MKFAEYTSSLDALPVPEWIIAERYMYCDNFINDYTKTRHFDLLAFVKRLLLLFSVNSKHQRCLYKQHGNPSCQIGIWQCLNTKIP